MAHSRENGSELPSGYLDRRLAEQRLFPAMNIAASETRKEAELLDSMSLRASHRLRRLIADLSVVEATSSLIPWFEQSPSNEALIARLTEG